MSPAGEAQDLAKMMLAVDDSLQAARTAYQNGDIQVSQFCAVVQAECERLQYHAGLLATPRRTPMSDRGKVTDSSIARMAGNIAAGFVQAASSNFTGADDAYLAWVAKQSVKLAHLIAKELVPTEDR
jgi:hypothetical protein